MNLKKSILPLLGVIILLSSCNRKKIEPESFTLNAQIAIDKYNGTNVYLQIMDLSTDSIINIDTTEIQNNKFSFIHNVPDNKPSVGLISYEGSSKAIPFIMEKGVISLTIDSTRQTSLDGTILNNQYQDFATKAYETNSTDEFQTIIYNYIKSNIDNPIGEYFLMTRGKSLNIEQLKSLVNTASPEVRKYANFKNLENRMKILKGTAIGQHFIDLKGFTPEGKEIALSDFAGKGKYTLIDFWASWCPPCRREMPAVVALYKKYSSKDFNIVGISIDDSNADWQKGIKDLNITWSQISDLKGWKSPLAEVYGVTSIPQTFLLDKQGVIIAKGFNAEELAIKLKELLD